MSDKGLRLKPPSPLPRGPVSKIAFKVFLNQLRAYLEQDCSNKLRLSWAKLSTIGTELNDNLVFISLNPTTFFFSFKKIMLF